jgi:hypothetical protein
MEWLKPSDMCDLQPPRHISTLPWRDELAAGISRRQHLGAEPTYRDLGFRPTRTASYPFLPRTVTCYVPRRAQDTVTNLANRIAKKSRPHGCLPDWASC